ncbi:hypothetical protein AYI68_g1960 [Smittium mucronatum]|uniref:RRM domain-containing protein n=1 Tax=Smittium mucronatum TaxID=133383 RepID=A0A1R0H461_9FUNG|nr:hypothetical protein AYI68_g1960 [Smittium mucronatum]
MEEQLEKDIHELRLMAENELLGLPPVVKDMKLKDFLERFGGDISKANLLSSELTFKFKEPITPANISKSNPQDEIQPLSVSNSTSNSSISPPENSDSVKDLQIELDNNIPINRNLDPSYIQTDPSNSTRIDDSIQKPDLQPKSSSELDHSTIINTSPTINGDPKLNAELDSISHIDPIYRTQDSKLVALYIKNLSRPLTVAKLYTLLDKFGSRKDFWINSNKSRCYIAYENSSQANKAFLEINGINFPDPDRAPLTCGLLSHDRMMELIDQEESARVNQTKLDLINTSDSDPNLGVQLVDINLSNVSNHPPDSSTFGSSKSNSVPNSKLRKRTRNPSLENISRASEEISIKGRNEKSKLIKTSLNTSSNSKNQNTVFDRNSGKSIGLLKTKAKPSLYYLPLTEDQILLKKKKLQS